MDRASFLSVTSPRSPVRQGPSPTSSAPSQVRQYARFLLYAAHVVSVVTKYYQNEAPKYETLKRNAPTTLVAYAKSRPVSPNPSPSSPPIPSPWRSSPHTRQSSSPCRELTDVQRLSQLAACRVPVAGCQRAARDSHVGSGLIRCVRLAIAFLNVIHPAHLLPSLRDLSHENEQEQRRRIRTSMSMDATSYSNEC